MEVVDEATPDFKEAESTVVQVATAEQYVVDSPALQDNQPASEQMSEGGKQPVAETETMTTKTTVG